MTAVLLNGSYNLFLIMFTVEHGSCYADSSYPINSVSFVCVYIFHRPSSLRSVVIVSSRKS